MAPGAGTGGDQRHVSAPRPNDALRLVPRDDQDTVRAERLHQTWDEARDEAVAGAHRGVVAVVQEVGGDPGEAGQRATAQVAPERSEADHVPARRAVGDLL